MSILTSTTPSSYRLTFENEKQASAFGLCLRRLLAYRDFLLTLDIEHDGSVLILSFSTRRGSESEPRKLLNDLIFALDDPAVSVDWLTYLVNNTESVAPELPVVVSLETLSDDNEYKGV